MMTGCCGMLLSCFHCRGGTLCRRNVISCFRRHVGTVTSNYAGRGKKKGMVSFTHALGCSSESAFLVQAVDVDFALRVGDGGEVVASRHINLAVGHDRRAEFDAVACGVGGVLGAVVKLVGIAGRAERTENGGRWGFGCARIGWIVLGVLEGETCIDHPDSALAGPLGGDEGAGAASPLGDRGGRIREGGHASGG